jgi:predicted nucleic acid-binding protein
MAERLERFIADFAIRIEPIGVEIARRAAELRVRSASLRLADALVLATGDVLDAALVLTADRAWPSASRRATLI